ncbi:MAG: hypothetical protein N2647_05560 [Thermodesulfovibrio sp.]|nr:hypothetical protein [Thermodesulfovibrio sp.]
MFDQTKIELTIIQALKELQCATEFFLIKKVNSILNSGNAQENIIKICIKNLHEKKFIISTFDELYFSQKGIPFSIKAGEEEKYLLNPEKWK